MIKIYGKANCSYCDSAKALLNSKGIAYEYLSLGTDFVAEEVKAIAPGARTFPIIIVDGVYIGGFSELSSKIGLIEQSNMGQGPTLLNEDASNVSN